jgi:hypothetical protein
VAGLTRPFTVIARSESDEAIQNLVFMLLDCFAYARNDGDILPLGMGDRAIPLDKLPKPAG